MRVEVVYALPRESALVDVQVEPGATLREAIRRSGLLERYPEIDLNRNAVGVFGRRRALDEAVAAGDRIEIYRPLPASPMEQRRTRAAGVRGRSSRRG